MKSKLMLCLALILSGSLLGCSKNEGSSKVLTDSEISSRVAGEIMLSGILGPLPKVDTEFSRMKNSLVSKIHGVRGFTKSDGFHGDGTDWYEVDLSPELAAKLRSALGRSPDFKRSKPMDYLNNDESPSWWPTRWPADAQCYEKNSMYLILPDSGTRGWFMQIRT